MPPVSTAARWASLGPNVLCSRKRTAARWLTVAIVSAKELDGAPLVAGLTTVRLTVPATAGAVPVAVRCEPSTNVAARSVEPRRSWAPLKDLLPMLVIVHGALELTVDG